MKTNLLFICLTACLFQMQEAQTLEGKRYSIGSGSGGYQTTFGGNGNVTSDEDNPDAIASWLESKSDKENRLQRKALKDNIAHLFSETIPKNEQSEWTQKNDSIEKNGSYGEVSWSANNRQEILTISYEKKSNTKLTISEFIITYSKGLLSKRAYQYSINVISNTNNSSLLEVEKIEKGTGDLLKKNTQVKTLEQWIMLDDWLIGFSYSNRLAGDSEKNEQWNLLRTTWGKRFSNVQF